MTISKLISDIKKAIKEYEKESKKASLTHAKYVYNEKSRLGKKNK